MLVWPGNFRISSHIYVHMAIYGDENMIITMPGITAFKKIDLLWAVIHLEC